jgi:hypothetical protein
LHPQVLWKVVVVHRFAGHPLHGFIDLLFLANTSAIILDERHSGYYLHGRNQMHHSGGWVGLQGLWHSVPAHSWYQLQGLVLNSAQTGVLTLA